MHNMVNEIRSKHTAVKRKSVLLVAYYFPPIGGGGVQRAFKMAKYLGSFDWDVHVLTVDPIHHVSLDPTLLEQLPADIHIHRTKEIRIWNRKPRVRKEEANSADQATVRHAEPPKPSQLGKIKKRIIAMLKKFKNTVMTPDDQILWYPYARRKGLEVIREHNIDIIFSTSGPHSAHLVGNYLKRKSGLPWIANFQDPWTQNNHRPDARWRRWIEDHMEARVMRESDCVVTVTHSFARNFVNKYSNEIKHIEVIHNGFDRADYEHLERRRGKDSSEDGLGEKGDRSLAKWELVYTGILYEKRNPRLLLKAIAELIAEGRIPRERIVLRFAGVFDYPGNDDNISCVYELGLQDIVEVLGHLPHRQALQALADADTLMLINDTHPGSGDYIPGKLFEYMAIGHPILALSLQGESTRIIEEHQLGEIADPTDLHDIKRAVLKLYEQWHNQSLGEQSAALTEASTASEAAAQVGGVGEAGGAEIEADGSEDGAGVVKADGIAEAGIVADPPRASSLIYERKEQARMLAELMNELTTPRV